MCIGKPPICCFFVDAQSASDNDNGTTEEEEEWKGWKNSAAAENVSQLGFGCSSPRSLARSFLLLISQLIRPLNNMMVCCSVWVDEDFSSFELFFLRFLLPHHARSFVVIVILQHQWRDPHSVEWRWKMNFPLIPPLWEFFSPCRAKSSLFSRTTLTKTRKLKIPLSFF